MTPAATRRAILKILEQGDATAYEVVTLLGTHSYTTVWRRLRELEAEGAVHIVAIRWLWNSARQFVFSLENKAPVLVYLAAKPPSALKLTAPKREPIKLVGGRDPLTAALFGSYNT